MSRLSSLRLLVALALPACGGRAPATPSTFYEELAAASCDWSVRCGHLPRADLARCRADAIAVAREGQKVWNVDEAVTAGRLRFDAAATSDCLSSLNGRGCNGPAVFVDRACGRVLTPLAVEGGACKSNGECVGAAVCGIGVFGCAATCGRANSCVGCGADQYCDTPTRGCRPRRGAGEICDTDEQCGDLLVCNGLLGQRHCTALPRAGEPCFTDGSCASGAYCDRAVDPDTCATQLAAGAACSAASACADGLTCAAGSCAPWLDRGMTCTPGTVDACPSFAPCDAPQNVCGAETDCSRRACTTAGQSCDPSSKQCTPRVHLGEACDPSADQCLAGSCDASSRTCAPPRCS